MLTITYLQKTLDILDAEKMFFVRFVLVKKIQRTGYS